MPDLQVPPRPDTLLLMAHGTRDPEGIDELLGLSRAVQGAAPELDVAIGVLEFPSRALPSIRDVVDCCLGTGAQRLIALPLLLHRAGHSKQDMPEQIAAARLRYPGLRVRSAPGLEIEPPVLEITLDRAHAAEQRLGRGDLSTTALLLISRGSSDPVANAAFFEVGRMIRAQSPYGIVECGFVSLAEPQVVAGIERCITRGAGRVVVVPYFLSTGILVKRIGEQAQTAAAHHPGVAIVVGQHFGVDPRLIQLIVEQARRLASAPDEPVALEKDPVHA